MMLVFEGRRYLLERVQLEELPEWRRARGLTPVAAVTLGDGDDWPPMVLYEYEGKGDG